jgi:hypothetical protein
MCFWKENNMILKSKIRFAYKNIVFIIFFWYKWSFNIELWMVKRRNKAEIRTNIISILNISVFDNVAWGAF